MNECQNKLVIKRKINKTKQHFQFNILLTSWHYFNILLHFFNIFLFYLNSHTRTHTRISREGGWQTVVIRKTFNDV